MLRGDVRIDLGFDDGARFVDGVADRFKPEREVGVHVVEGGLVDDPVTGVVLGRYVLGEPTEVPGIASRREAPAGLGRWNHQIARLVAGFAVGVVEGSGVGEGDADPSYVLLQAVLDCRAVT